MIFKPWHKIVGFDQSPIDVSIRQHSRLWEPKGISRYEGVRYVPTKTTMELTLTAKNRINDRDVLKYMDVGKNPVSTDHPFDISFSTTGDFVTYEDFETGAEIKKELLTKVKPFRFDGDFKTVFDLSPHRYTEAWLSKFQQMAEAELFRPFDLGVNTSALDLVGQRILVSNQMILSFATRLSQNFVTICQGGRQFYLQICDTIAELPIEDDDYPAFLCAINYRTPYHVDFLSKYRFLDGVKPRIPLVRLENRPDEKMNKQLRKFILRL